MKNSITFLIKTAAWTLAVGCFMGGTIASAQTTPGYSASRFPGVNVRHVPKPAVSASESRAANRTGARHTGMVARNVRRIPNTQRGYMADVDETTLPHSSAVKTASGQILIKCIEPGDHSTHNHARLQAKSARAKGVVPKTTPSASRKH